MEELPDEARVLVQYLAGSIVNWWYKDEAKIPESFLGTGEYEEGNLDYAISLLKKVTVVLDAPAEVASWLSGSAVGWLGQWWSSKSPESSLAQGFNNEKPPIPPQMLKAIEKLNESFGEKEDDNENIKEEVDQGQEEETPTEEKGRRQITIPPITLALHEMKTQRGDEDKTGGLIIKSGFQISLFDKAFPDITEPVVEISMPWMWGDGKISVEQVQQLTVIKNANLGILNIEGLGINNLKLLMKGWRKPSWSLPR